MLASKCKNPGKQISGSSYDQTDVIEPVLYSSPIHKEVQNASLERIGSVREYVQTNLLNLFGARMLGPG
jgi:hypothetical protein